MNSRVTYDTAGSVGPYTIPFPYLTQTDIQVYLDGVLKTFITHYTFPSAAQVLLNVAPSAAEIEIRRVTQTTPYIDFADAGVLVETDLDTSFLQPLFLAIEANDIASLGVVGAIGPQGPPGTVTDITAANISDASADMKMLLRATDYLAARLQLFDAPIAVTVTNTSHFLIDAALGSSFSMVPGISFTLDNPTNPTHGQRLFIRIKQDATGGRVVTLDTAWRLGTDIIDTLLSTAANKVDYLGAVYDSTDAKWDIIAVVRGY